MRFLEEFVFSCYPSNTKLSLPPVVVFLAAHVYPSYAGSDALEGCLFRPTVLSHGAAFVVYFKLV